MNHKRPKNLEHLVESVLHILRITKNIIKDPLSVLSHQLLDADDDILQLIYGMLNLIE